jgi:hypothetical protein
MNRKELVELVGSAVKIVNEGILGKDKGDANAVMAGHIAAVLIQKALEDAELRNVLLSQQPA